MSNELMEAVGYILLLIFCAIYYFIYNKIEKRHQDYKKKQLIKGTTMSLLMFIWFIVFIGDIYTAISITIGCISGLALGWTIAMFLIRLLSHKYERLIRLIIFYIKLILIELGISIISIIMTYFID